MATKTKTAVPVEPFDPVNELGVLEAQIRTATAAGDEAALSRLLARRLILEDRAARAEQEGSAEQRQAMQAKLDQLRAAYTEARANTRAVVVEAQARIREARAKESAAFRAAEMLRSRLERLERPASWYHAQGLRAPGDATHEPTVLTTGTPDRRVRELMASKGMRQHIEGMA